MNPSNNHRRRNKAATPVVMEVLQSSRVRGTKRHIQYETLNIARFIEMHDLLKSVQIANFWGNCNFRHILDSDNICSSACKEKGIPMYCFVEGILVRRAGVRRSSVLALKWALQISRAIAKDPARSVLGRVSHLSCLHELRPCISNAVTLRLMRAIRS